jgi:drug/metabolite transporter (DMT)-like permease
VRLVLLIAATLVGFASNSLLTRGALGGGHLDPASFTLIRLVTGALTLALLVRLRGRPVDGRESWASALWLVGYAITFTLAYVRIGAAVGALLLFGAVQVTMIGSGLVRGERPARIDWAGAALALGGLVVLTLPGLTAPDVIGATLMLAAGVCWGAYSLAGRTGADPLGRTARNFTRASVLAVPFLLLSLGSLDVTPTGVWLAIASGSLASGVAYTLWYMTLPRLAAWRAAIVQLIVPVLTALAAAALLGEAITPRLVGATGLVAAGVWLTVWPSQHRRGGAAS